MILVPSLYVLCIARSIISVKTKDDVYKLFSALNGATPLSDIVPLVSSLKAHLAAVRSSSCWQEAAAWVTLWTRLKMLCKLFSEMKGRDWDKALKDTNAVERLNRSSKTLGSVPSLHTAMEMLYKKDKELYSPTALGCFTKV